MGSSASTTANPEQEQDVHMNTDEDHWRNVVIEDLDKELGEEYDNDEELDSEEEVEFSTLLGEYELLYTLAVLDSEKPVPIAGDVDDEVRAEAALRTQQSLNMAMARAEAKLNRPMDSTTSKSPADATGTTPSKARSTGKKRLASLRKRVAELREMQEGGPEGANDGPKTPVRRLNFNAPLSPSKQTIPAPNFDEEEQTPQEKMQEEHIAQEKMQEEQIPHENMHEEMAGLKLNEENATSPHMDTEENDNGSNVEEMVLNTPVKKSRDTADIHMSSPVAEVPSMRTDSPAHEN